MLSSRLFKTQYAGFFVEALLEAIEPYGCTRIFNTDRVSQFSSTAWTDVLKDYRVWLSMDGEDQWIDTVFIKRLWRSLQY